MVVIERHDVYVRHMHVKYVVQTFMVPLLGGHAEATRQAGVDA
jgi:hypothetical protein